jgi:hypothetical protein
MTFQAGQSGNPGGRKKDRPFLDALMMEAKLAEAGEDTPAPKGSLRWNARQLLEKGDVQSIKELADRIDGKVPTPIAGDDENPLNIVARIERVIVRPS